LRRANSFSSPPSFGGRGEGADPLTGIEGTVGTVDGGEVVNTDRRSEIEIEDLLGMECVCRAGSFIVVGLFWSKLDGNEEGGELNLHADRLLEGVGSSRDLMLVREERASGKENITLCLLLVDLWPFGRVEESIDDDDVSEWDEGKLFCVFGGFEIRESGVGTGAVLVFSRVCGAEGTTESNSAKRSPT